MRQRYAVTALVFALAAALSPALAKKEDFTDQDLRNKDFQNANLDGSNFTRTRLGGANFYRATVRNALWEDADVNGAMATKADFSGGDFRHAVMPFIGDYIKFTDADFRDIDMAGYGCYSCVFDEADLRGTSNWGRMAGGSFRRADLRGADLRGLTVMDVSEIDMFIGAVYDDATLWPEWVDMKKLRAKKIGPDDPAP